MKRLLFAVFLALSLSAVAPSQTIVRGPYIQNLKTDAVDVLWRTDEETQTWVSVRRVGERASRRYLSTVPTTAHEIRVPRLAPGADYEYRAGFSPESLEQAEWIPFRTLPAGEDAPLSFIIYGDHRNYPDRHRAVVEAILERTESEGWPQFILDTGDYTGQGEHATDFWDEQFFDPTRGLIERVCFFPVIGNHESLTRHPRIPFRYLENFSVPTETSGTEYYYSFDVGDAHFIMLDVYATDFEEGSKQWHWLREDLKNTDKKWRFASMHYPIYIHRTGPTVSYGNQSIREHLVPLFEEHGVAAVFSGDSHFYQRSEVNGIAYVCSGGGGAPLYDPGDGPEYVRASAKVNHYVWARIDGDRMTMHAYDAENNLIDSVEIGPRKPVEPEQLPVNFTRRLPDATMTAGVAVIVESRDASGALTPAPVYQEFGTLSDSTVKSTAPGLAGQGTRFSDNTAADVRVRFTPPIESEGQYLLSVTVPNASSVDAPNSYFEVYRKGEMAIRGRVDLSAANAGDKWYDVGLVTLAPGDYIELVEVADEPARFYADAIRVVHYVE